MGEAISPHIMGQEILNLLTRDLDIAMEMKAKAGQVAQLSHAEVLSLLRHGAANIAMMYSYRTYADETKEIP